MRAMRLSVLALLFLTLVGCGGKAKDLIVGKWEPADPKEKKGGTIEFTKDGDFLVQGGPLTIKGKYKFIDDKTMEIELENPLAAMADKMPGVKMNGKPMEKTIKQKVTIKSISKNELVVIGTNPEKKDKETKLVARSSPRGATRNLPASLA